MVSIIIPPPPVHIPSRFMGALPPAHHETYYNPIPGPIPYRHPARPAGDGDTRAYWRSARGACGNNLLIRGVFPGPRLPTLESTVTICRGYSGVGWHSKLRFSVSPTCYPCTTTGLEARAAAVPIYDGPCPFTDRNLQRQVTDPDYTGFISCVYRVKGTIPDVIRYPADVINTIVRACELRYYIVRDNIYRCCS